jgi:hypothetical protein
VASTRCWVSNPVRHPQHIEWLRYPPDTLVDPAFQRSPHICYVVDDLAEVIEGRDIILGPFEPGDPPFALAAFTSEHGIVTEYLHLYPDRTWFDDDIV